MHNVELSDETLDLIFDMAQTSAPKEPTDADILNALKKIQVIISSFMDMSMDEFDMGGMGGGKKHGPSGGGDRDVLIVDDIGVVTYQMKVLFEKNNCTVETAKDIYSAIKLFKRYNFAHVVMDLFVSTEREGYLLLDEVKKMIVRQGLSTKIIMVTASSKGEHRLKCMNKGADKFIIKDQGWQEEILKICTEPEPEESEGEADVDEMMQGL